MNINTLTTQEPDYKSGSLPVALYPNAMRKDADGKESYFARPIIRERLAMEDIASDMIVAGVNDGLTKEQIVSVWNKINGAVLDRVANSCSVDTGLCLCSAKVTGSFETENSGFSKDRHAIDMAFRSSKSVRENLSQLNVVIRQGNSIKPQISDVYDLESGGAEFLTKGGFLEITGSNLALFGDDESVGLYFENIDHPEKSLVLRQTKMGTNSSNRLACVVPPDLEDGNYRLKVVTQFTRSKAQRKEPLVFTFDKVFNVISE